MLNPLKKLAGMMVASKRSLGRCFGYDAVEQINRRQHRRISRKAEDVELEPSLRRTQLTSNARDLVRNFPAALWSVRLHCDNVSNLTFHSRTGDTGLDSDIDQLYAWFCRPQNCDIAARHSFPELIRLMEEGAVVIGDHAILLTRGWKLQGIEGDRICSIAPGVPDSTAWPEPGKFFNGVKCDNNGRPISYSVCRRLYDSFTFEREIPAAALVMHMYTQPGRIDQWRGITPLAPSVNSFADAYEMAFYAIQKCKQAASYGFVIKSEEFENEDKYDRDYSIDLSRGPFQKLLSPEESMEWMRAEWPAMEFQKFYREIVGLSLKSLMQPSLFFLDGEANMSEQRAKVAQWMVFIETRRDVLRTAINRIWAWRLSGFIQEGQLKLPRTKKTIDDLKWEWVAPGATSLNPVDDAKTACMELAAGITSPQRVCKARGDDAAEILREISQWDKMRIAEGVAEPMYGVVGKAIVAPDTEDDVQSSSATQSSNGGNQ